MNLRITQAGIILLMLVTFVPCFSQTKATADSLPKRQWTIDGVTREALVYVPPTAKSKPTPIVFFFHGHGGTMEQSNRKYQVQKAWPEAIVVYPQGLKTVGPLTDPEGKRSGWQHSPGNYGDRDLKFFDAMLASLIKDYKVDQKRIYSTGHSNGGGYTYLLWAMRGDVFAAMAPSASTGATLFNVKPTPKPVMHLAGEKDDLVKFNLQREGMDKLLKLNSCTGEGKPYGDVAKIYASSTGNPVVLYIHPGAHVYPAEAIKDVVRFFKENPKK